MGGEKITFGGNYETRWAASESAILVDMFISTALFILLNSKVVTILPSSSEESQCCYYCSWVLKFFTKSLVGDLTHCFSVYVSSKKISILISSLAAKNHTPSPHKPKSHPPARDWELAHLCTSQNGGMNPQLFVSNPCSVLKMMI